MGKRIYVGNLSYDATEEGLRALFAQSGSVGEVKLMTDRETGRSRGFAFVEMSTDAEARNAISQLNGRQLDGRSLRINEAEERTGGGGGGGGGFRSGGASRSRW
jgi:RNA recognition motif-containing protein